MQWVVSRYIAAHAVQNLPPTPHPYPFSLAHVGTRLAHVASLAAGWPTIPTTPTPRRVANVAITHDGESFTVVGHSPIGTWKKSRRGCCRGNANETRQS